MSSTPIRLALVNDYEIVVVGLANALAPYADRVEIVELDANAFPRSDVDLVLYDTFAQNQGGQIRIAEVSQHGASKVVVFSWNVDAQLIAAALDAGVSGYIAKTATAEELVAAIEAVHRGEQVVVTPEGEESFGQWPGNDHGLSNREAEVLALIAQGLTNNEICERTYLSPNTLKSYVRNLYRKIGVSSRSQAVLWGLSNGFEPDHLRRVL